MKFFSFFIPWEPSPMLILSIATSGWLFARGTRGQNTSLSRKIAFWSSLFILYLLLHTKIDYYAQHQFFIHRLQHLGLHHLAPLLMMYAFPFDIWNRGLPLVLRTYTGKINQFLIWEKAIILITNPIVICILFVFSVIFWLVPSVQLISMLDSRIYCIMNWSVVISGLMYWAIVLDHRLSPPALMSPAARVISPLLTMIPQMLTGAIITFSNQDLYPIFGICGRALLLTPQFDQNLGGLITWIPAAALEAVGTLIALRHLMRLS